MVYRTEVNYLTYNPTNALQLQQRAAAAPLTNYARTRRKRQKHARGSARHRSPYKKMQPNAQQSTGRSLAIADLPGNYWPGW